MTPCVTCKLLLCPLLTYCNLLSLAGIHLVWKLVQFRIVVHSQNPICKLSCQIVRAKIISRYVQKSFHKLLVWLEGTLLQEYKLQKLVWRYSKACLSVVVRITTLYKLWLHSLRSICLHFSAQSHAPESQWNYQSGLATPLHALTEVSSARNRILWGWYEQFFESKKGREEPARKTVKNPN